MSASSRSLLSEMRSSAIRCGFGEVAVLTGAGSSSR